MRARNDQQLMPPAWSCVRTCGVMWHGGANFPSSELTKGKATLLPNSRSLVGVPVLFALSSLKKITTKEEKERKKKITHAPSVQRREPRFSQLSANKE